MVQDSGAGLSDLPEMAKRVPCDADHLIRKFAKHRSANQDQTIFRFRVTTAEWEILSPRIAHENLQYVEPIVISCVVLIFKCSSHYYPSTEQLVIQMPSRVHENFLAALSHSIENQLSRLSEGDGPVADFAKDVQDDRSATVRPLDPRYGTHDPDASFRHLESEFPGVVIEVAYAQEGKRLDAIAEDYILGSDHQIRVVVAIDINYNAKKNSTFTIWRGATEGPEEDKVLLAVHEDTKVVSIEALIFND